MISSKRWAERCFLNARLGDVRRTKRLVQIARRAAQAPAGRVTEVFENAAARQAAYDFLEHDQVSATAVGEAVFESTALACRQQARVLVAVDGTSVTLVDERGAKNFGRLGNLCKGGHGLKLINALALSADGTPLGVADQVWWSRHQRADRHHYRARADRESVHWSEATDRIIERYTKHSPGTKLHFLVDREGDAAYLITSLLRSGHEFTIRSNARRKVLVGSRRVDMRRVLARLHSVARIEVALPSTASREQRVARLEIRTAQLPIVWRDHHVQKRSVAPLTVVWAREVGRRSGVEWVLFTNVDVSTAEEAVAVVRKYTLRWRIEDFHKTWKSGLCRVEDTQLRSKNAVIKWATILAAVAARAEHLRHLARETPEAPASQALSTDEIDALVFLRNRDRVKAIASAEGLTIKQATRWIADAGGYVGARSSGLPGAITIGRGLEKVAVVAEVFAELRAAGKLR